MLKPLILGLLLSGCSTAVVWEEKGGVNLPHLNLGDWHVKARLDQIQLQYRAKF